MSCNVIEVLEEYLKIDVLEVSSIVTFFTIFAVLQATYGPPSEYDISDIIYISVALLPIVYFGYRILYRVLFLLLKRWHTSIIRRERSKTYIV